MNYHFCPVRTLSSRKYVTLKKVCKNSYRRVTISAKIKLLNFERWYFYQIPEFRGYGHVSLFMKRGTLFSKFGSKVKKPYLQVNQTITIKANPDFRISIGNFLEGSAFPFFHLFTVSS